LDSTAGAVSQVSNSSSSKLGSNPSTADSLSDADRLGLRAGNESSVVSSAIADRIEAEAVIPARRRIQDTPRAPAASVAREILAVASWIARQHPASREPLMNVLFRLFARAVAEIAAGWGRGLLPADSAQRRGRRHTMVGSKVVGASSSAAVIDLADDDEDDGDDGHVRRETGTHASSANKGAAPRHEAAASTRAMLRCLVPVFQASHPVECRLLRGLEGASPATVRDSLRRRDGLFDAARTASWGVSQMRQMRHPAVGTGAGAARTGSVNPLHAISSGVLTLRRSMIGSADEERLRREHADVLKSAAEPGGAAHLQGSNAPGEHVPWEPTGPQGRLGSIPDLPPS